MSSRQQEKERRRQERQAAEQAAARSASRKRRLRLGGAALLIAAVGAAIAVVALAGGGGDDEPDQTAFAADARAAGCTFNAYRSEGRDHTSGKVRYRTNPPTSGRHNPVPAQDGIYQPGNEPAPENAVHSLEHGRVLYQYKPGTPEADVRKLRALAEEEFNGSPGYHTLLFQNNTRMTAQFALTSWTKSLTCNRLTPESEDVMREFRRLYTDKAPEFIP
ncbi:MAG TPA: DUF3105 domain-containing protein [Solirubrobacteraceae bacterium]|nr:DUF3105 domain-containing protein [Solirubrobacteraceae bacterium]